MVRATEVLLYLGKTSSEMLLMKTDDTQIAVSAFARSLLVKLVFHQREYHLT